MSGWKEVKSEDVKITNESTSNTISIQLIDEEGDIDSWCMCIEDLENIAKCIDKIRAIEPNCL